MVINPEMKMPAAKSNCDQRISINEDWRLYIDESISKANNTTVSLKETAVIFFPKFYILLPVFDASSCG